MDIKTFSRLPSEIKNVIHDVTQFKKALKKCLYLNSF
jgi:hypothetical protein